MFNYLKLAFKDPLSIVKGKEMSFNTFFKILMILVGITLIPTLITIPRIFGQFQEDFSEISAQIPEFQVQSGTIETNEEDYIHLTDTVAFYFDPQSDLYDDDLIERNVELGFAPLNVSLTNDRAIFYVNGMEQEVSYESIPNFNNETLSTILGSVTSSNWFVMILSLIILFMTSALLLLYQLGLIILTNYIIAILQSIQFKLGDVAKISILSITLPIVAVTITSLLNISTVYTFQLFTFFSTILFLLATLRYKKKLKDS